MTKRSCYFCTVPKESLFPSVKDHQQSQWLDFMNRLKAVGFHVFEQPNMSSRLSWVSCSLIYLFILSSFSPTVDT